MIFSCVLVAIVAVSCMARAVRRDSASGSYKAWMKFKKFKKQIVYDIIPNVLMNVSIYPLSIRESSTKGIRNVFSTSSLVVDQTSKAFMNSTYRAEIVKEILHSAFQPAVDDSASSSLLCDVIFVDNNYEIRNYSSYTSVNVKEVGDIYPDILLSSIEKFNALALYLTGRNKDRIMIAMTTPVVMTFRDDFVNNAEMSFVLPKNKIPPDPLLSDKLTIEEEAATVRIVKSFSGLVTNREMMIQKKKLVKYVEKLNLSYDKNEFKLFQYDSPLVAPWDRKNEVSVALTNFTNEFNMKVVLKSEALE